MSENTHMTSGNNQASKQANSSASNAALIPRVDVIEDKSGITLYADLAGVPKDKLALNIEADTLTIEGEVGITMPEGMEPSHAEINLPRYRRVFSLSKELDSEKISAAFEHGVLKLNIPKAEHLQPRKIEIQLA